MSDNLRSIARCLERHIDDLVISVLDRPRHEGLIREIRSAGARTRLIGDGDLSAGIAVAVRGAGVHAVMGIGGAPEGVLTAAALRCLHGEMVARLVIDSPEQEARVQAMGMRLRRLGGRRDAMDQPCLNRSGESGPEASGCCLGINAVLGHYPRGSRPAPVL